MKKSTTQSSLLGKRAMLLAKLFLVGIFLVSQLGAFAQQTITGTVTEESGAPLPGVTVFVKGTTTGGITDIDGNRYLTLRIDIDEG